MNADMDAERAHRLEQLYHSALEHPDNERSAFLKSACGRDDALLEEIESLLAHDRQADSFIERPALEVAARLVAQSEISSRDGRDPVSPGQTVSHYRIIEKLGEAAWASSTVAGMPGSVASSP